ncbi:uncharacterized protein LY79DRAFT_564230 [Colletotrichum navitas]|uniref:Uncharacterized protein n=1 Tax=Colletotrichum navitas TaxID=681940 RepID=A0AAD8PRM8_9PEZI|nr:uncharacterized protein LY79DRAFT_564230 [Colletotrichum navitas]KAK1579466.1 hypothetical protein LY79DRAFT_564230 [Colletotrichum navitas]
MVCHPRLFTPSHFFFVLSSSIVASWRAHSIPLQNPPFLLHFFFFTLVAIVPFAGTWPTAQTPGSQTVIRNDWCDNADLPTRRINRPGAVDCWWFLPPSVGWRWSL